MAWIRDQSGSLYNTDYFRTVWLCHGENGHWSVIADTTDPAEPNTSLFTGERAACREVFNTLHVLLGTTPLCDLLEEEKGSPDV